MPKPIVIKGNFKIINIVDKKFLITIINDEDLEIYKLLNYD